MQEIRRRRSIHDQDENDETVESDYSQSEEISEDYDTYNSHLHSESNASLNDISDANGRVVNRSINKSTSKSEKSQAAFFVISLIIVASLLGGLYFIPAGADNKVQLSDIKTEYPLLKPNIWNNLEVSIEEIKSFNKPMTIMFIYRNQNENYMDKFVKRIALYASCDINDDCIEPIQVPKSELIGAKARADFGYIIDKYKEELRNKSVMIVQHLEQIPGKVAQAFHSFCDEETPLIPKALFLLTLRIDENAKGTEIKMAENVLRKAWGDIGVDIFDPLFTRLTGLVVEIN